MVIGLWLNSAMVPTGRACAAAGVELHQPACCLAKRPHQLRGLNGRARVPAHGTNLYHSFRYPCISTVAAAFSAQPRRSYSWSSVLLTIVDRSPLVCRQISSCCTNQCDRKQGRPYVAPAWSQQTLPGSKPGPSGLSS